MVILTYVLYNYPHYEKHCQSDRQHRSTAPNRSLMVHCRFRVRPFRKKGMPTFGIAYILRRYRYGTLFLTSGTGSVQIGQR